jgi:hypothetical protein
MYKEAAMGERIKNYLNYLDEVCKSSDKAAKAEAFSDILVQIGFFQHERLIHLIVTFLFAMFAIITLWFYVACEQIFVLLLFILVMVLLIPYIRHYYLLENSVQKMYEYYDILRKDS